MYRSEAGRFSQDTSVIMATMVELTQRMLTKRPTVARTSDSPILFAARIPTRAKEAAHRNDVSEGCNSGWPGMS